MRQLTPEQIIARLERAFPGCVVQQVRTTVSFRGWRTYDLELVLPDSESDTVDAEARVVEDTIALPAPVSQAAAVRVALPAPRLRPCTCGLMLGDCDCASRRERV